MPKYLIEVPHEGTAQACIQAVQLFLRTGSHFLTHAAWGCKDGVHKAWITIEVTDRDEAQSIIPPEYRSTATIVQLNEFTMKDIENIISHHAP